MEAEIIKIEQQIDPLAATNNHYKTMINFVKASMKEGQDYGIIPGTNNKPTLLKPGAEKLCRLFSLYPQLELVQSITDFDKPLFHYHYRCTIYRHGEPIGQGEGICNSKEKKYLKKQDRICPKCGASAIIKGKAEFGGGWLCYAKKGGCNAKFALGDEQIESQPTGYVDNPEIFDSVNTICKMAQKRATIAAVLVAVGASEFFSHDLEDDAEEEPKPKAKGNFPTLIEQTTVELQRLGWSNAQGRLYLQETFNKNTRAELTDAELRLFLNHLRSLSEPT
jgi:ribosomal protein S27AE